MPQTLQAFLAMFVVTLLSVNQQRTILESYDVILDQAIEVMSAGVAMQALEYITSRDFDAAVIGSAYVTSPSDLSASPFTTGNNCLLNNNSDPCNDMDDYHAMTPDTIAFVAPNGGLHNFSITAEVFYVDPVANPDSMVTYKTYSKMVVVYATDAAEIMHNPVRLSRLVTCEPSEGCN